MNLLKRIKKQLKELDTTVNQKIAELKEAIERKKQVENKNTDEEKEKMDKIFEKRQIGRPAGDFNSKRRQYFVLIKAKKKSNQRNKLYSITKSIMINLLIHIRF